MTFWQQALRRCTLLLLAIAAASTFGAVILDRVAVIIGQHVIKISDIQRDLHVTEFLNREPVNVSSKAKRQSAERLIDQEVIRQELIAGQYRRPPESEASALEKQLIQDRYEGSEARLRQDLAR